MRSPSFARRSSSFAPTIGRSRTGLGARKAASPPAGTTQTPSGLAASLATLATSLFVATPAEAVIPTSERTRSRINPAINSPSPNSRSEPDTSRYASSVPADSQTGEKSRRMAWKRFEAGA